MGTVVLRCLCPGNLLTTLIPTPIMRLTCPIDHPMSLIADGTRKR
jgi:hypothetical protein